jgi:cytidine deaminase
MVVRVSSERNIDVMVLTQLSNAAWSVREHAFVLGSTKVGCALITEDGSIYGGCNIEHRFRSHDIHAEVNAIGTMVTAGGTRFRILLIAAEREFFTPCGACMDWIMQFASDDAVVVFQGTRAGEHVAYLATELMPYYPR